MITSLCFCQSNHAKHYQIDDECYIRTHDTKLFAHIRGTDSLAPVLLYLHGGPGSPLGIPILKAYAGPRLEEHFILVYLHQRGIMKSPRVPDSTHTFTNYINDVFHVIRYLKGRFQNRDIYLLGHSWGGLMAYQYIKEHPKDIRKLVAVCSSVNIEAMIRARLEMMLQWAHETENQHVIEELSELSKKSIQEDPEEFRKMEEWMTLTHGGWHRNLSFQRINQAVDYEDRFPAWLEEQKYIEDLMIPELLKINLTKDLEEMTTPLLCIAGKEDSSIPWFQIKNEFDVYGGPKNFILFQHSHHMVFVDEEYLFVQTILTHLLSKE